MRLHCSSSRPIGRFVRPRPDRPHAAGPPAPVRARDARASSCTRRPSGRTPAGRSRTAPRARMILEGEASGALTAGQDDPRRDVGQHRHRLRDDRRGARLQGEAVRAGEREPGAQADPARARRRAGAHQSARRHRRRDSRGAAARTPRIRTATSIRTSTTTTATGARTTTRPAPEIIEQTERPADALRRRPRHERHVRRHRPAPAASSTRRSS